MKQPRIPKIREVYVRKLGFEWETIRYHTDRYINLLIFLKKYASNMARFEQEVEENRRGILRGLMHLRRLGAYPLPK